MDKHEVVSLVVAVIVAIVHVLVAVRSLCCCYLAPTFTLPSPGRIRRKIATLCCFLLLLVVVFVVVFICLVIVVAVAVVFGVLHALHVLRVVHALLYSTVTEEVDGDPLSFSSLPSLISLSAGD
jgi:hypothetical protein